MEWVRGIKTLSASKRGAVSVLDATDGVRNGYGKLCQKYGPE
jgi:hypothetical protein